MKRATLTHIYEERDDQAIGVLQVLGERGALFTMEPGIDDERPRLPDGTYLAKWIHSPTYGWTWTLVGEFVSAEPEDGVPRNQCRIHSGNDDEESVGCILPGLTIGWDEEDMEPIVISSRAACKRLKRWIGEEDFLLVIKSGRLIDSVS